MPTIGMQCFFRIAPDAHTAKLPTGDDRELYVFDDFTVPYP